MLVGFDENELNNTIIYLNDGEIYRYSSAILRIARLMGFPHNLLYILILIPPFIRNYLYKIVARNRYKWFGKSDSCIMPENAHKDRFLN